MTSIPTPLSEIITKYRRDGIPPSNRDKEDLFLFLSELDAGDQALLLRRVGGDDDNVVREIATLLTMLDEDGDPFAAEQRPHIVENSLLIPTIDATYLSHYNLSRPLGGGTDGDVRFALEVGKTADVPPLAIKIMSYNSAKQGMLYAANQLAREQNMKDVPDPRIVKIHSAGHGKLDGEDVAFIAMQYIPGENMKRWIRSRDKPWALDIATAVRITIRIAEALHTMHEKKILHRDVKPSNLIGCELGTALNVENIRLGDFSSSRDLSREATAPSRAGTVGYMAPEQILGQEDRRSDVFSLAMTLLTMLSGHMVNDDHPDDSLFESKDRLLFNEIKDYIRCPEMCSPVRLAELMERYKAAMSPQLLTKYLVGPMASARTRTERLQYRGAVQIIQRCLSGDPACRYETSEALAHDLHNVLKEIPISGCHYTRIERIGMFFRRCRRNDPEYRVDFEADRVRGMGLIFLAMAGLNLAVEIMDHVLHAEGLDTVAVTSLANNIIFIGCGAAWICVLAVLYRVRITQPIASIGMIYIISAATAQNIVALNDMVVHTQVMYILYAFTVNALSIYCPSMRLMKWNAWLALVMIPVMAQLGTSFPVFIARWGPNLMGGWIIAFLFCAGMEMKNRAMIRVNIVRASNP